MMLFDPYYRRFGVRRASELAKPKLSKALLMQLPINSILHYVPDDEVSYGISTDDPLLRHERRVIQVDSVTELTSRLGAPRPLPIPAQKLIRDYHQRYRRTRPLKNIDAVMRDPRTLLVYNYAILSHTSRYLGNFFAGYNKWYNINSTCWQKISETAKLNRQNFLVCKLPDTIPSMTQLRRGMKEMTRSTLQLFDSPEKLFILELWKWLGPERHNSMLAQVAVEDMKHVNLIWQESDSWFVLNLGLLDGWRKPTDLEVENGVKARNGLPAENMQRRLLAMLINLQEARTEVEPAVISDDGTQWVSDDDASALELEEQAEIEALADRANEGTKAVVDKAAEKALLRDAAIISFTPDAFELNESEEETARIESMIDQDMDALEKLAADVEKAREEQEAAGARADGVDNPAGVAPKPEEPVRTRNEELVAGVAERARSQALYGRMSAAELRRFETLAKSFMDMPNPIGGEGSLADFIEIKPEEMQIDEKAAEFADIPTVYDKSMLKSTLSDFTPRYVTQYLQKHIAGMVMAMQNAGVAVTQYTMEPHVDAMNDYIAYTVRLTPVDGKPSTLRFRLPRVQKDGTYLANGVRYRLATQRNELPIRKVNSRRVALSSYYGKLSVSRNDNVKYNLTNWLGNRIAAAGNDSEDQSITDLRQGTVFDHELRVPRIYSQLSQRFRSFAVEGDIHLFFDHSSRFKQFKERAGLEAIENTNKGVICGYKGPAQLPIFVDDTNTFYLHEDEETIVALGDIYSLTGLDRSKSPIEMIELTIFDRDLPLGVVLAYYMGLETLLSELRLNPRRVPRGERAHLAEDEFSVVFNDETLVFKRDGSVASMLMVGFNVYEKSIRNYSVYNFDQKDIYYTVLENNGVGVRYIRELESIKDLFLDPITVDVLKEMGEPVKFMPLLRRAAELLQTDWSPQETDTDYQRFRGYERMAGAVYNEMARAVRTFRARPGQTGGSIEMSPHAVWMAISKDTSQRIVEEANPIHNLKEIEEVTFSGTGGRSGRSMVKRSRVYHKNDKGKISEATKDSGEVAITTSFAPNPLLTNLYGMSRHYIKGADGPSSIFSTPAMLSPTIDRDDPKRVNFASIQHSRSIAADGYRPTPLRTGYEQVIAQRTSDLFAKAAEKNGRVVSVSDDAILVEYEDGTTDSVELGRRFGIMAGATIPHQVVPSLKAGDTFKRGDNIAYNSMFFEKDLYNKSNVVWKAGVLGRVALLESVDTFEDSSVISERMARELTANVTKVREIQLSFDQHITDFVGIGDVVDVESILCTIEESTTAENKLFDAESRETLRLLSSQTPRAKAHGVVEKIEVLYHGEIEDMSPSLAKVARASDSARRSLAKASGQPFVSGMVDDSLSIGGRPLLMDNLIIKVYITGKAPAGVGGKIVLANQLKSIVGRVMAGKNITLDGKPIDLFFGFRSVNARIVMSPAYIGTTNTIMIAISKMMAKIYRGNP